MADNSIETLPSIDYEFVDEKLQRDIEINLEKEEKQKFIINQINKLYDIIQKFKSAELIVYNPYIFSGLTQEKLTHWIINNNNNIKDIFISCHLHSC